MSRTRKKTQGSMGECAPVIGSRDAVDEILSTPPDAEFPSDELGKHLVRLLRLHPDLDVKFRRDDIGAMDRETKLSLLRDIEAVLGIRPFRSAPT